MQNVKAKIEIEVPEWQIGQEASIFFPDTMNVKGICKKAEEREDQYSIATGINFKDYGTRWTVLDSNFEGKGMLCISRNIAAKMPFSTQNSNNYAGSDIAKYLADLTKEYEEKGAKFATVNLDLTADDGTGWDNTFEVNGLFLLTADLYRKYRRCISRKNDNMWHDNMWLATAYSFAAGCHSVKYVFSVDGTLGNFHVSDKTISVVPACVFQNSAKKCQLPTT